MSYDIWDPNAPVHVGRGGRTEAGSGNTIVAMDCAKKFQFEFVRGIRIPKVQMEPHFAVGIIFAAMRREWFGRKFDTSEKVWPFLKRNAQKEAEAQGIPIRPADEASALVLFDQYMKHWALMPKPKPVAAELKLGPVALVPGDPRELWRTARLDDLSYYNEAGGALCIGEAKTTSSDAGSVVREYELHPQPMLYLALYLASKLGAKRYGKVAGVVLDITGKPNEGRKKPTFSRVFVEIREEAVRDFVESTRFYVEIAKRITWDSNAMRSYHCTKMHGRMRVDCTFKPLCRFGKSAAGQYVLADGTSLKKYQPKPGAEKMPWE